MKINLLHKILISCCFIVLALVVTQKSSLGASNSDNFTTLVVKVSPEFPKAYQEINVTVDSFSIDIQRSLVRWYVDGSLAHEGVGATEFSLSSGAYGSKKMLRVQAISADGRTVEREVSIAPSDVTILLQPDTYVPPFYKGKRLYTSGANVVLTAISSSPLNTSSLIYEWSDEGGVLSNGAGKDKLLIDGNSILREIIISVDVRSIDGTYTAHEDIIIKPAFPKLVVYENNPIYGVWFETTIETSKPSAANELGLVTYPLFFSTKNRLLNDVSYEWSINSIESALTGGKSSIVLRRDPSITRANVEVQARHTSRILQLAEISTFANFTNKAQ